MSFFPRLLSLKQTVLELPQPDQASLSSRVRPSRSVTPYLQLIDCHPIRFTRAQPIWEYALRKTWKRLKHKFAAHAHVSPLEQTRLACCIALVDLPAKQTKKLYSQITSAQSLRELWHLRTAIFEVLLQNYDRPIADHKLALLDKQFPMHLCQSKP